MSDYILYFYFYMMPFMVVVLIPTYFIINVIRWGFEKIEELFPHRTF